MPPVGGGHVGLVQQPPVVLRHVVLGREDHRPEVAAGHPDALLGQAGPQRVEVGEAGDEEVGHGGDGLGLLDPRVGVVGGGLRRGHGAVDLPGERGPVGRVLGQQVVQDGGAGPGLADDHDRARRRALGHLGMGGAPVEDLHPVAEVADHLRLDDGPAQVVEPGRARPGRRAAGPAPRARWARPCRRDRWRPWPSPAARRRRTGPASAVVVSPIGSGLPRRAGRRSGPPAPPGCRATARTTNPRWRPPVSSHTVVPSSADGGRSAATTTRAVPSGRSATPALVTELGRRRVSMHSCQMFSTVTLQYRVPGGVNSSSRASPGAEPEGAEHVEVVRGGVLAPQGAGLDGDQLVRPLERLGQHGPVERHQLGDRPAHGGQLLAHRGVGGHAPAARPGRGSRW